MNNATIVQSKNTSGLDTSRCPKCNAIARFELTNLHLSGSPVVKCRSCGLKYVNGKPLPKKEDARLEQ